MSISLQPSQKMTLDVSEVKTDMEVGFVMQPGALLPSRKSPHLCNRLSLQCRRRGLARRAFRMGTGESNDEVRSTQDSKSTSPQTVGDTGLIVDIGDSDMSGEDIVDILGLEGRLETGKRKSVRKRTNLFVEEITQKPENVFTSDADVLPPIDEDETALFVRTAVRAADKRKAEDVVALRISKLSYISSFIVIITGNNVPQVRAIGNLVQEELAKKNERYVKRKDGTANSGWLLLDYGDFMINVFLPEQRESYNLEGLWKQGELLDISDCISGPGEGVDDENNAQKSLDDWLNE